MRNLIRAVLIVMLTTTAFADISLYWTDVTIPDPIPHPVPEGDALLLNVDMGITFSVIDSAWITFTFENDLWDIGEQIVVFFPTGFVGMSSTAHEPYDPHSWSLELGWGPPEIALMDGQAIIAFQAVSGSVSIQSCKVEVWAEVVPEPSAAILIFLGLGIFGTKRALCSTWKIRKKRLVAEQGHGA